MSWEKPELRRLHLTEHEIAAIRQTDDPTALLRKLWPKVKERNSGKCRKRPGMRFLYSGLTMSSWMAPAPSKESAAANELRDDSHGKS